MKLASPELLAKHPWLTDTLTAVTKNILKFKHIFVALTFARRLTW